MKRVIVFTFLKVSRWFIAFSHVFFLDEFGILKVVLYVQIYGIYIYCDLCMSGIRPYTEMCVNANFIKLRNVVPSNTRNEITTSMSDSIFCAENLMP